VVSVQARVTRAFRGSSLEVATFHDIDTGEPLATLRMPRTGQVVDVPRYRSGPSKSEVVLHLEDEQPFGMARETKQGGSFFRPGVARRRVHVSEPERDGATFRVREDLDTRVIPGDPSAPDSSTASGRSAGGRGTS